MSNPRYDYVYDSSGRIVGTRLLNGDEMPSYSSAATAPAAAPSELHALAEQHAGEWSESGDDRTYTFTDTEIEAFAAALAASLARAEPVTLTVEMSQFLTDVTTAAGLLSHGKRDNELASRIGEFAFRLTTGTAPAFLAPSAASSDARDAALEEAARICDLIGKDWFDAGMDQKGWAAEYVAQQIRTAMSAPAAGEAL